VKARLTNILPNILRVAALAAGLLGLKGCTPDVVTVPDKLLVVEAYMYVGLPVTDVRITRLDINGREGEPVTDATVAIENNGILFPLRHFAEEPGRYYDAIGDIEVVPGNEYELLIAVDDQQVTATTQVPLPPRELMLNTDLLLVADVESDSVDDSIELEPLQVSWFNPEEDYFFPTLINEINDPIPYLQNRPPDNSFINSPIDADNFVIFPDEVMHYGKHSLILYSMEDEFLEIFFTQNSQPSDFVETDVGNIENGRGIFTGFSSDTVYFFVSEY